MANKNVVHRNTGAGTVGVFMECPRTGQPHRMPLGGVFTGMKTLSENFDGSIDVSHKPYPWCKFFFRFWAEVP